MVTADAGFVAGLLGKIRCLAPLVNQHREAFDSERRLPQPVLKALADQQLLQLWLPRELGGPELSPHDFMEVVEAAAELDGSVGWLVGNGAGMSRVGGYLPEPVARAWFDAPQAFIASATGAMGSAVKVKNGFRVNGRWPFGSGAHHATLFMGLCSPSEAAGDNSTVPLCCYFPRPAVTILDTWHVSGLRGTGSCDFEIRDVLVPFEHTHPLLEHRPTQPGLLYRMPIVSTFSWSVAVVPLGIARAAANAFVDLAAARVRVGTSAPLRERELIQSEFGRADAQLRAGRAGLRDAMTELMVATDIGDDRLVRARAMLRAACTYAAETAIQVVDRLSAAAGAIAIFESAPLERCVRDVHAAVKHAAMSPNNYVISGRLGLGLAAGASRF